MDKLKKLFASIGMCVGGFFSKVYAIQIVEVSKYGVFFTPVDAFLMFLTKIVVPIIALIEGIVVFSKKKTKKQKIKTTIILMIIIVVIIFIKLINESGILYNFVW